MAIKKQEFYEGAALHLLARTGAISRLQYLPPFFLVNESVVVLLKYSTRVRSPWGFTFTPDEQELLHARAKWSKTIIGLICGADGIAAFGYERYQTIAGLRASPLHISCYRRHREHYEVNGPDGTMVGKVAPSDWYRILED
jgi:hypothetical protein